MYKNSAGMVLAIDHQQTPGAQGLKLGKAPAISNPSKSLSFGAYMPKKAVKLPKTLRYITKKPKPLPHRTFGNDVWGCCTKASEAAHVIPFELKEMYKGPIISDDEVIRVYKEMVPRWGYGQYGDDTGAYEMHALSDWRKPDYTFRDTKGNPYTIDAFTRINQWDIDQMKLAIYLNGVKGIKICFNLPIAWYSQYNAGKWDIPAGQLPIGEYLPGSWGGHSMFGFDYTPEGIWLFDTWGGDYIFVTWRAIAIYCDEAYSVIDSIDTWKKAKQKEIKETGFDFKTMVVDVNSVSSQKIK